MKPKFYTLPPIDGWPYVLINANRPNLSYVRRNWRHIESVIIDSGVEIFRSRAVKDYPPNWFEKLIGLYNWVKTYVKHVMVTVPDYPDDYNAGSLWVDGKTNIERTVDNIVYALDHYPKVDWLIPIQGWNKKPCSLALSIRYLRDLGIIKKKGYFAIANLCVENRVDIILKSVGLVRSLLPNKRLHVFGIKINALRKIHHLIDSFDSFAWTRPILRRGHSAKNLIERRQYFYDWLNRFQSIPRLISLEAEIDGG